MRDRHKANTNNNHLTLEGFQLNLHLSLEGYKHHFHNHLSLEGYQYYHLSLEGYHKDERFTTWWSISITNQFFSHKIKILIDRIAR